MGRPYNFRPRTYVPHRPRFRNSLCPLCLCGKKHPPAATTALSSNCSTASASRPNPIPLCPLCLCGKKHPPAATSPPSSNCSTASPSRPNPIPLCPLFSSVPSVVNIGQPATIQSPVPTHPPLPSLHDRPSPPLSTAQLRAKYESVWETNPADTVSIYRVQTCPFPGAQWQTMSHLWQTVSRLRRRCQPADQLRIGSPLLITTHLPYIFR